MLVKSAAAFALAAIAAFFIVLTLSLRQVNRVTVQAETTLQSVSQTAAAAQRTIEQMQPAIADLKPTIADVRRTILIAGGTLNLARDTLRNEQASIREANEQTIATMHNVNALVAGAGESQKAIAQGVAKTLETIQPVMAQTQKDLATLDLAIEETRPLLANSTATMANTARISGDLAKIADEATKPQPWYRRAWGYLWAPIKLAAVFAK